MGVAVGAGVDVGADVAVGVGAGVEVGVGIAVGAGVGTGGLVGVGIADTVASSAAAMVSSMSGVAVGVGVEVGVGVGVGEGEGEAVGVGTGVAASACGGTAVAVRGLGSACPAHATAESTSTPARNAMSLAMAMTALPAPHGTAPGSSRAEGLRAVPRWWVGLLPEGPARGAASPPSSGGGSVAPLSRPGAPAPGVRGLPSSYPVTRSTFADGLHWSVVGADVVRHTLKREELGEKCQDVVRPDLLRCPDSQVFPTELEGTNVTRI